MKYTTLLLALSLLGFSVLPSLVFAEGSYKNPSNFGAGLSSLKGVAGENKLATNKTSTKEILQTGVKWLLSLVGTIAVISLLYGGYLYISSQGDEGNVEKAKSILLYSVIGILLIGLSAIIVNVVINVATK
jgi:hypothetical protein